MACAISCGGETGVSQPEEEPLAPTVAPRWLAMRASDDDEPSLRHLSVLRFDDVAEPRVFRLATAPEESARSQWVRWSPNGSHVAFLTCSRAQGIALWVASAENDFARQKLDVELVVDGPLDFCEYLSTSDLFAWMGDNTLFVAAPVADQRHLYRVALPSAEVELLGTHSGSSSVFSASRFGVLYTLPNGELWAADESGSPRLLGTGFSTQEGGATFANPLTWAPDGQSATYWTQWAPAGGPAPAGVIASVSVSEQPPPQLEIVPEQSPRMRHIHVPTGLVVDLHPHGDLYSSNNFGGTAFAPVGPALAYSTSREALGPIEASSALVLYEAGERDTVKERATFFGGLGQGYDGTTFGFLGPDSFYFSRVIQPQEADQDSSVELAFWQEGEERTLSVGRYAPAHVDGFAESEQLFFARTEADRRTLFFVVDLAKTGSEAQRVAVDGLVIADSILKRGLAERPPPGYPSVQASGAAVLLATSDDTECRFVQDGCQTERWVIDLESGIEIHRLDQQWVDGSVVWAADGLGLLALQRSTGQRGLFYIPGSNYRGSFLLHPDAVEIIVPPVWPTR